METIGRPKCNNISIFQFRVSAQSNVLVGTVGGLLTAGNLLSYIRK